MKERREVTHDVDHIVLEPPHSKTRFFPIFVGNCLLIFQNFVYPGYLFFRVPVGHHVQLQANVEGMELARSYTPVCRYPDFTKKN